MLDQHPHCHETQNKRHKLLETARQDFQVWEDWKEQAFQEGSVQFCSREAGWHRGREQRWVEMRQRRNFWSGRRELERSDHRVGILRRGAENEMQHLFLFNPARHSRGDWWTVGLIIFPCTGWEMQDEFRSNQRCVVRVRQAESKLDKRWQAVRVLQRQRRRRSQVEGDAGRGQGLQSLEKLQWQNYSFSQGCIANSFISIFT